MRRHEGVLFVATLAALAALPWTAPNWPTQDGPAHLAVAHVLQHYDDPGAPFAKYFTVERRVFVPSTLYYRLLALLSPLFAFSTAEKLFASLTVLLVPACALSFVRRIEPAREAGIFLILPLVAGWALAMGFSSYLLATACGYVVLALAIEEAPVPVFATKRFIAAFVLLISAWFHPAVAAMTGLALVLYEGPKLARTESLGKLAIIGIPVATFLVWSFVRAAPVVIVQPPATRFENLLTALRGLVEYHVAYSAWEILPRGVALGVLGVFVLGRIRRIDLRGPSRESGAARIVAVFTALYFVLPKVLADWFYCDARFLIFGTFLLPSLVAIETRRARWVAPAGAALAVVTLALDVPEIRRLSAATDDVTSVGSALPRGSKLLPFDFTYRGLGDRFGEIDEPKPLLHAWARLVETRDVVTAQMFAAGKPWVGGERFRALAYREGVLDPETGTLPWVLGDDFYAPARLCRGDGSPECMKAVRRWITTVGTVLDRYDFVLFVGPPSFARSAFGDRLRLRARAGVAWLYEVVPGHSAH